MISQLKIEPLNQPKESSILYRYVTIDKLLDFLFGYRFPLVRLNNFQDKLEGASPDHLLLNYTSDFIAKETANWIGGLFKHIGLNIYPTKRNTLRRQREIFQETNYASCWYISDHESVAMWHLYSKPDSVAIRIPYKILKQEIVNQNFDLSTEIFKTLSFGCVEYSNFNDLANLSETIAGKFTLGFVKDLSFQHEKEFRIILEIHKMEKHKAQRKPMVLDEQIDQINSLMDTNVIYLRFSNFRNIPFEIVFHPQSHKWHRDNIIKIMTGFKLPFKTSESNLIDIFN